MTETETAASAHQHVHAAGHHHHPVVGPLGAESYPHVRGGPQVLDIGGDIGALEATMNPDSAGTELHLRSEHRPPVEVHTGVWHRTQAENPLTTAVFAELPEGAYWVLDSDGAAATRVIVNGGELSRIDLR
jgi:hypothetical protein